jgi:hypothetical protein
MATMVDVAQRMLTNRPTVARISDKEGRLVAISPTRASDPRTEITRPKEVTVAEPGIGVSELEPHYDGRHWTKR